MACDDEKTEYGVKLWGDRDERWEKGYNEENWLDGGLTPAGGWLYGNSGRLLICGSGSYFRICSYTAGKPDGS